MFERYTERARRVIFFARYEASHYGSPTIEAEHLLLGLLRENKQFAKRTLSLETVEGIRSKIDARFPHRENIPTSVDLPLSMESKHILTDAADEAERLGHKYIGTEHLLLDELHSKMANAYESRPVVSGNIYVGRSATVQDTIKLHGSAWNVDYLRDVVQRYNANSWHWRMRPWVPMDMVVHRFSGKVSFDLNLAQDEKSFQLVKGGWKQEHCAICRWTLLASEDPTHNSGYTNGRDWLCIECYEKFFKGPDFFSSSHPEIT